MGILCSRSFEGRLTTYTTSSQAFNHPILGDIESLQDLNRHNVLIRSKVDISLSQLNAEDITFIKSRQALCHENLLQLRGASQINEKEAYAYFEYFQASLREEIFDRAKDGNRYSEEEIFRLLKDVSAGLAYLQQNRISYEQVSCETIVKVDSNYKLIDAGLITKYKGNPHKFLQKITKSQKNSLASTKENINILNSTEYHYARSKDDIYTLATVALDAISLCTDYETTISEKLETANLYYSKALVSLINQMMEGVVSLRFDPITCNRYIEDIYRQSLETLNFQTTSRHHDDLVQIKISTYDDLSHEKPPRKSILIQDYDDVGSLAQRDSMRYAESFYQTIEDKANLSRFSASQSQSQPFTQSQLVHESSSFDEILRNALPTRENKDTFFSNLPDEMSNMAEKLLADTFSVKTPTQSRIHVPSNKDRYNQSHIDNHSNSTPHNDSCLRDDCTLSNYSQLKGSPVLRSNVQTLDELSAQKFSKSSNVMLYEDLEDKRLDSKHNQENIPVEDDTENFSPDVKSIRPEPLCDQMFKNQRSFGASNRELREIVNVPIATYQQFSRSRNLELDSVVTSSFNKENLQADKENQFMTSLSPINNLVKEYSTDYTAHSTSTHERKPSRLDFLTLQQNVLRESPPEFITPKNNQPQPLQERNLNLNLQDSDQKFTTPHPHPQKLLQKIPRLEINQQSIDTDDKLRLPSFGDDFQSQRGTFIGGSSSKQVTKRSPSPSIAAKRPSFLNTESKQHSEVHFSRYDDVSPSKLMYHANEVYSDGTIYQGEMKGKLKHGVGRLTFPDESCYEGQWADDKMSGYGVFFFPDGKIAYEGEWQNNKCNGRGVMYNEQITNVTNRGKGKMVKVANGDWERYEGGFCNDRWEGEGRLFFVNGDEFCGDFVNDLIHGFGRFTNKDGESFEGEWCNNKLVSMFSSEN